MKPATVVCKGKGVFTIHYSTAHRSHDSRREVFYNLGSGSWLEWANDVTANCL